jgi:hypothetical protein
MKKPLLPSDKYYTLIPKTPIKIGCFIWSSYSYVKDGEEIITYWINIEDQTKQMTEEELFSLYNVESIAK